MADPIQEEINKEVAAHKILIYGKGHQADADVRVHERDDAVFRQVRVPV